MTSSLLQIESNRRNAQSSTGPRTPEGKRRSCLNATRHGLTGQIVVLPSEDLNAYQTHCDDFVQEWRPVGPTEKHLVQTLADCQWRLHRAYSHEHALYAEALVETEHSVAIDRIGRYASRIQRDYHNILRDIQNVQQQRKAREEAQMEQAAMLQKFFAMKEEEWNPAEFGFVLTLPQIQEHLHLADRLEQAKSAKICGYKLAKYTHAVGR